MVKPKGQTRPPSGPDLATRDRILDAANTVFLRHGTAAARTREIADQAGVNKALLHYYFGTKEALAAAVFERVAGEFFSRIFATLRSALELEDKVRQLIGAYLEFLPARPYVVGYIVTELHAGRGRAEQLFAGRGPVPLDLLDRQIQERVAAGAMRPIPVQQFVVNLISLIVFPFVARPVLEQVLRLDGPRFAAFVEERKRTLADFFLNALRP
jgi:TetR/AcrR family transcriptional regulator